jgi:hypothetical protein
MRTKTLFKGFKNSQRIRVIVNEFGFITTVDDAMKLIVTESHRNAVEACLGNISESINKGQPTNGLAGRWNEVDVQVDFITE